MKQSSDICIVGAGIGGLSCASELAADPACRGLSLQVFDAHEEVGGRIRSAAQPACPPVELGAERYSPGLHPAVLQLLQRHGRHGQSYPFARQQVDGPAQQALQAALLALSSRRPAAGQGSFLDACCREYGPDAATGMIRALGYDALLLPEITIEMAHDIVGAHPETQALTGNGANRWFCVEGGMQGVLREMQARTRSAGVHYALGQRLLSVTPETDAYRLVLRDAHDRVSSHETRHLLLALPPSAMPALKLDFPQGWSLHRYGSLPLFKGFLFYSRPWWLAHGLRDQLRMVDNPMRKVYFRGDGYLFFYNDSASAGFWRSCLADGEAWYLATVRRHLATTLGLDEAAIPAPVRHLEQFWPHGVEYHLPATPPHPPAMQHAPSGVIACSDAYTAHCGWMEGSLQSARAACSLLRARLLACPRSLSASRA